MALRRLAWERSWVAIVAAVWLLSCIVYFCLEVGTRGLARGDILLPILALPPVVLLLRRGLAGSHGKRQLWIDTDAGTLVLPDGTAHRLDQLGELSIAKRYQRPRPARQPFYLHELRAASIDGPLYTSPFARDTQRRLVALEAAIRERR